MIKSGFRISVDPEDNDGEEVLTIGMVGYSTPFGESLVDFVKREVSSHEEEWDEEYEEE